MRLIPRTIRRAIQAGKPPTPRGVIEAPGSVAASDSNVPLVVAGSLDRALAQLQRDPGDLRLVLVPDPRSGSAPGPRVTHAVATALGRSSGVTIGLPPGLRTITTQRWGRLAADVDADVSVLGTAGWNRVTLGERSLILEYADVPAELHDGQTVIALSSPNRDGCIALWSDVVHPNTALRARMAPESVVELSAAIDARYLLVGEVGMSWFAIWASTGIAAELVARGIERLRERSQGIETPGPWEDAGVQHLFGLGDGTSNAASLVLRVRLEDNVHMGMARQLSELLGWRLAVVDRDEAGDAGDSG